MPPKDFVFIHSELEKYARSKRLKNTILRPIIEVFLSLPPEDRYIGATGELFNDLILAGGMAEFQLLRDIIHQQVLDQEPVKLPSDAKTVVA